MVFWAPKTFFLPIYYDFHTFKTIFKKRILGQKSKFSGFLMLQIMSSVSVGDDQNFEKSVEMRSRRPLDASKYLG